MKVLPKVVGALLVFIVISAVKSGVAKMARQASYKFSASSLSILATVDPRLQELATRALLRLAREGGPSFAVVQGRRTREEQAELVRQGKSRNLDSAHLYGLAIDVGPDGWSWEDLEKFRLIRKAFVFEARLAGEILKPELQDDEGHIELVDHSPKNRITVQFDGYRRARTEEIPRSIQEKASEVLFTPSIPQGGWVDVDQWRLAVETHYDIERGNHRGVSVFVSTGAGGGSA